MSSPSTSSRWLFSTIGRRGYVADYFKEADPDAFILGTGNSPHAAGLRDCDEVRLLPSIADPSYPDAVLQLVQDERIEHILTFSDLDVVVLAAIRPELMALGATCWFPDEPLARLAQDKLATSLWAEANGMPTGQASMDLGDFNTDTPLIIKPRFGSSSIGLAFPADHPTAAKIAAGTKDAMFQRRIFGTEFNLEILGDQSGHPIRCSAWRKFSSRVGETDLARSVRRDDLIDLAWELSAKLGLIGPNDVDLIVNEDGAHLIEVNTRFGGGYPVSHFAGAGFPHALLAIARGETVCQEATFRDGIWMMKATKPFGGSDAEMQAVLGGSLEKHFPV